MAIRDNDLAIEADAAGDALADGTATPEQLLATAQRLVAAAQAAQRQQPQPVAPAMPTPQQAHSTDWSLMDVSRSPQPSFTPPTIEEIKATDLGPGRERESEQRLYELMRSRLGDVSATGLGLEGTR